MLKKFKILLWRIGILKEEICPICKGELMKTGFEDELTGEQRFICLSRYCFFNKSK